MSQKLQSWYQQGKQYFFANQHQIKKIVLLTFATMVLLALLLKLTTFLLVLTLVMWTVNMVYAAQKPRQRLFFLLLHITFFVFLLGRPFIELLRSGSWVEYQITNYGATEDSVFRTVYCMIISLIGLLLGNIWAEKKLRKKDEPAASEPPKRRLQIRCNWRQPICILSLALFSGSAICKMILEIEKMVFVFQNSYVEYYSKFTSSVPYIIYIISTFLPYAMCAYLAMLPRKRSAYIVLGVYALTAVPIFLAGERNELVVNLILAFAYFVFRDYLNSNEKWIGKIEKIIIACGATFGIVALAAMNYIRENSEIQKNFLGLFVDFFDKQGVTFSWVCVGLRHIDLLRNTGVVNYTFGSLVDYMTHGSLAQKLFHAQAMPSGNSLLQISDGNKMSHHLSYIVLGSEQYLAGHGTGSSYLLEIYIDYDMLGILLFSIALGALLALTMYLMRTNAVVRMCAFCGLDALLLMPRSSAIGFLEFLWRIPFWCTIVYLIVGTILICKLREKNRKGVNTGQS